MTKARDDLDLYVDNLGFGPWEREYRFLADRKFRFDLALPAIRLAIEYDGIHGGAHGSINGVLRDSEKLNLAQINGWMIIRVNAKTIQSGQAFTWIEQAVAQRSEAA